MFKNIVILWAVWQGAGDRMCVSETYKLVPFEPLAPSFSFTASQITALLSSMYNVHQGVTNQGIQVEAISYKVKMIEQKNQLLTEP